jgi:hypothetical protein
MGREDDDERQRRRRLAEPGRRLRHRLRQLGAADAVHPERPRPRQRLPPPRHDGTTSTSASTSTTSTTSAATATATATATASSTTASSSSTTSTASAAASASASTTRALCGAAGDRPEAQEGEAADPGEALLGRPRPAGSLEASGPRDRPEPEGQKDQAPRLPGQAGRRPQVGEYTTKRNEAPGWRRRKHEFRKGCRAAPMHCPLGSGVLSFAEACGAGSL